MCKLIRLNSTFARRRPSRATAAYVSRQAYRRQFNKFCVEVFGEIACVLCFVVEQY